MNNFQFYLDCQGFAEILYVIIASNPQTISFLHFTYICKIIHVLPRRLGHRGPGLGRLLSAAPSAPRARRGSTKHSEAFPAGRGGREGELGGHSVVLGVLLGSWGLSGCWSKDSVCQTIEETNEGPHCSLGGGIRRVGRTGSSCFPGD